MNADSIPILSGTGPASVRLFHRLLAIIFVIAWLSLGSQILVLCGSDGLLPARDLVRAVAERPDVSWLDFPTVFRAGASDGALLAGVGAGIAFALLSLFGVLPRLAFAAMTVLYLSYAVICRDFLSFQWDNLLVECGALAALLPARGKWVRLTNVAFRVLLFKLYFESGIAKYQSYLGDWRDGSAMTFYYETAPLPTRLAWYAHHFSVPWHHFESLATLTVELAVPFLIFSPRPSRLFAASVFTGFQCLNILTANYGFFAYLAIALHVFLLDERDVFSLLEPARKLQKTLRRRFPRFERILRLVRVRIRQAFRRMRRFFARRISAEPDSELATLVFLGRLTLATVFVGGYLAVSFDEAEHAFSPGFQGGGALDALASVVGPLRVANVYHLFGHITQDRIEPTFEVSDGSAFREVDLHYKPGDPARPPPFVAPHQPRVDFSLWFYGLSHDRGVPLYVRTLLVRLCENPSAVAGLFADPLPAAPSAVRVRFYRYHFTTAAEKRATGAYWTRQDVGSPRTLPCHP